jgi:NhaA family Na+:H+ antiporter
VPGTLLWFGFLRAGVHPTLAGVVLGLLTPATGEDGELPPTVTLVSALHPWIAFAIMPLFALANAGVSLGALDLGAPNALPVLLGVALGLLLGKPLGIVLACFLAVKAGISALPRGVTYAGVAIVGIVGGIGFTVAIFVANLAFADPALLNVARAGVLAGSFAAGVLGLTLGRSLKVPERAVSEITPEEAESSHVA